MNHSAVDLIARLNAALATRHVIDRELGRGGMATVYLAQDLKHPRQVALKVQHPNILGPHDSGTAGDLLYCVMPCVEGESLRHRLDRETQLQVDVAVTIAGKVADLQAPILSAPVLRLSSRAGRR